MNAVIYCRVSSRDQVEGTSLDSQESACREYAQRHNLAVSRVFVEEGESAKYADRTQLLELLSYCKDNTRKVEALIVWKVDRFARNVEDHYTIKAALRKLGVRVVSVTEPIEADPNGRLMETMLAGFAQFDNDVRAVRSVEGMKRRLQGGIFPWKPPLGYVPPRIGKKTEPDRPDPRSFDTLQKAWQLLATDAYSKADILRLLRNWGVTGYRGQLISAQLLDHLFRNPYYAGVLRDPWSGAEYVGRHIPMVTADEFARVQQILDKRRNSQPHHSFHEHFPLRAIVRCPSCKAYMTSSYSRGKSRRYPYYKCFRRNCPTRTRSYPAGKVHDEFSDFLVAESVPEDFVRALTDELRVAHSENAAQLGQAVGRKENDVRRIDRQLQELVAMRAEQLVSNEEFISQRVRLRQQRFAVQASEAEMVQPLTDHEARDLARSVRDLKTTWERTPILFKPALAEVILPAGYVHQGLRTPEKGLLFLTFALLDRSVSNEVPPDTHQGVRTPEKAHEIETIEAFPTHDTNVVPHVQKSWKLLITEIRRFLEVLKRQEYEKSKSG